MYPGLWKSVRPALVERRGFPWFVLRPAQHERFRRGVLHQFASAYLAAALAAFGLASCAPVLVPPGTSVMPPALISDRFRASDGTELPLRTWMPEGRPAALVLALHGFNDYSNAFAGVGEVLAQGGIATYAIDQRGFGSAPGRGLWHGADRIVQDAREAVALLRTHEPGRPVFVLGESMGGAVAVLGFTGDSAPRIDGLILVAPAIRGRQTLNGLERAMFWLSAHTLPWVRLGARDLPRRIQASDNLEMLQALARDPMIIKETRIDAAWGLLDLMTQAHTAAPLLGPKTIILYGEKDEVIPPGPTRQFLAQLAGTGGPRIAVYRDGWHMLLRDRAAASVLDDLRLFIADPAAPLPSGADRRHSALLSGD
jgi:acylglycerol lipase